MVEKEKNRSQCMCVCVYIYIYVSDNDLLLFITIIYSEQPYIGKNVFHNNKINICDNKEQ